MQLINSTPDAGQGLVKKEKEKKKKEKKTRAVKHPSPLTRKDLHPASERRSKKPSTVTIDDVRTYYEKARFEKIYGDKDGFNLIHPQKFYDALTSLVLDESSESRESLVSREFTRQSSIYHITACWYKFTDVAHPTVLPKVNRFLMGIMELGQKTQLERKDRRILVHIETEPGYILRICKLLSSAHLIFVRYFSSTITDGRLIASATTHPDYSRQIHEDVTNLDKFYNAVIFKKIPRLSTFELPTMEIYGLIGDLAPQMLTWLKDKQATAVKLINKNDNYELRFYRNQYTDNGKEPIIYRTEDDIIREVACGAFEFVPDSHYTVNDIPVGPYLPTIDLDFSEIRLEHEEVLDYFGSLYDYFYDLNFQNMLVCHSGNRSLHLTIPLNPTSKLSLMLPRNIRFDTYHRRRTQELEIQMLIDAIRILLIKYNESSRYPGAFRIPKYKKLNGTRRIRFDLRFGLSQGVRCPGSYHTKSGLMARVFDINKIPDTETELLSVLSPEYIADNPDCIKKPNVTDGGRTYNSHILVEEANAFYKKNFNRLIYTDKIFSYE